MLTLSRRNRPILTVRGRSYKESQSTSDIFIENDLFREHFTFFTGGEQKDKHFIIIFLGTEKI